MVRNTMIKPKILALIKYPLTGNILFMVAIGFNEFRFPFYSQKKGGQTRNNQHNDHYFGPFIVRSDW
jgi:hypothetical protein